MESKSFRECPKSTLMSLSANVSTGTFTLAKYKCVVSAPSAVCVRTRRLRIRYSPWPSARPCQGGRRWLEILGANVSFFPPSCGFAHKANVNAVSSMGESLESQPWILFRKDQTAAAISIIYRAYYNLNFTFGSDCGKIRQTPVISEPYYWRFCRCFWDVSHLSLLLQYNSYLPQSLFFLSLTKQLKWHVVNSWLSHGNERLQCHR